VVYAIFMLILNLPWVIKRTELFMNLNRIKFELEKISRWIRIEFSTKLFFINSNRTKQCSTAHLISIPKARGEINFNLLTFDANSFGLSWRCWLGTLESVSLKVSCSILLNVNFSGVVYLLKMFDAWIDNIKAVHQNLHYNY